MEIIIMENFIIEITISILPNIPIIKSYYEFNINQLDIFENWYSIFDDFFINNIIISRNNLKYIIIEDINNALIIKKFIDTVGNTFSILEEIDDLDELFENYDSYDLNNITNELCIDNSIDKTIEICTRNCTNICYCIENCESETFSALLSDHKQLLNI